MVALLTSWRGIAAPIGDYPLVAACIIAACILISVISWQSAFRRWRRRRKCKGMALAAVISTMIAVAGLFYLGGWAIERADARWTPSPTAGEIENLEFFARQLNQHMPMQIGDAGRAVSVSRSNDALLIAASWSTPLRGRPNNELQTKIISSTCAVLDIAQAINVGLPVRFQISEPDGSHVTIPIDHCPRSTGTH